MCFFFHLSLSPEGVLQDRAFRKGNPQPQFLITIWRQYETMSRKIYKRKESLYTISFTPNLTNVLVLTIYKSLLTI